MEYRQRRRNTQNSGSVSFAGALVIVCVLSAVVVGCIGLSKGGTWIAQSLIAPLFHTQNSGEQGAQATLPAETTALALKTPELDRYEITIPAISCYVLQMGVYSDYDNAVKQSSELKKLGGAGYILTDGGRYRVFASGYADEASLTTVKQKLEADGLVCASYSLACPERKIVITSGASEAKVLETAFLSLQDAIGDLNRLYIRFDGEGLALSDGKEALKQCLLSSRDCLQNLNAISQGLDKSGKEIETLYSQICTFADGLLDVSEENRTAFSSGLKYLHLLTVASAVQFLQGLEG